ncbi:hypothetical protein BD410DRAFT_871460 [Rickenella mellea]|uniref:Uncharacterized protein n=1 Tax=Rickenella mellea TaxID=50990 RepID=A0A4Y7PGW0_9AGAM|nr:hypothetical protein BD410DRAFT_871460 [Rickenella mellea]
MPSMTCSRLYSPCKTAQPYVTKGRPCETAQGSWHTLKMFDRSCNPEMPCKIRPRNREATVKNTRGPFQHLSVDIPRKNLICWSVATGQEVDLPDAGKYLQSLSEAYVYNESESGRIHSGEMFAVDHTIQDVTPFLPELEVMEPRPPPDYYPSTRRTDKTLMRCCYLGNQIVSACNHWLRPNNTAHKILTTAVDLQAKRSSRSVEPLGILENGHPSSLPSHIVEGESKALAATFHLGNLHQDRRDHIGDAPQAFGALFQSDALHDRASRFLQPAGAHQINIVSPERSTEYSRQLDGLALPSPTVYVCECGAVVETHSNKEVGHHAPVADNLELAFPGTIDGH